MTQCSNCASFSNSFTVYGTSYLCNSCYTINREWEFDDLLNNDVNEETESQQPVLSRDCCVGGNCCLSVRDMVIKHEKLFDQMLEFMGLLMKVLKDEISVNKEEQTDE